MSAPAWDLTPKEKEILALLAEGLTNPQIAARLWISVETVKYHVSHILGKLEVRTRWAAADIYRASLPPVKIACPHCGGEIELA